MEMIAEAKRQMDKANVAPANRKVYTTPKGMVSIIEKTGFLKGIARDADKCGMSLEEYIEARLMNGSCTVHGIRMFKEN